MAIKRNIVVSDIHGCIEEFDELIKTLQYDKNNDRIILLGDLIDRGPDSVGVVRRASELDLECVRGNHEAKFLRWYRNKGSRRDVHEPKPHYTQFSDEDVNYMGRMEPYIKIPEHNIIIVHGGLRANIKVEDQKKDDLYYLRYVDKDAKFISLRKISELGIAASGAHFWTEFWTGPESIVYGHNVHSYTDPLIQEVSPGVSCYGLDTGCCFGGRLTALILETKEIVQVQAKKIYYQSDFDINFGET